MSTSELRDRDGVLYKFPARSCLFCNNFPCMELFNNIQDNLLTRITPKRAFELHLLCDFAKYGCREYSDEKRVHDIYSESSNQ